MHMQHGPIHSMDTKADKYFCSQSCKFDGYQLTWKTLNMVDR